jgi:hypothetical protein
MKSATLSEVDRVMVRMSRPSVRDVDTGACRVVRACCPVFVCELVQDIVMACLGK